MATQEKLKPGDLVRHTDPSTYRRHGCGIVVSRRAGDYIKWNIYWTKSKETLWSPEDHLEKLS